MCRIRTTALRFVLPSVACLLGTGTQRQASAAAHEDDAKAIAEQANRSIQEILEGLSPEEAIPGYTAETPDAANYYSTDTDAADRLQRAGREHAARDPQTRYLQQAHAARPYYFVDPQTDPMLRRTREIEEAAGVLANDPTAGTCQAIPGSSAAGATHSTHTCYVYGEQPVTHPSCTRTADVSCEYGTHMRQGCTLDWLSDSISADAPWSYRDGILRFGVENDAWNADSCTLFRRQLTFDLHARQLSRLRLRYLAYDDWIVVRINGRPVRYGPDPYMNMLQIDGNHVVFFRDNSGRTYTNFCELSTNWEETATVDMLPYIKKRRNTLTIEVALRGRGYGYVELEILGKLQETWTEQCDPGFLPAGRSPSRIRCLDREQRQLDGSPVAPRCWQWRATYDVVQPPRFAETAACTQLRQHGCAQVGADCIDMTAEGYCARQRSTFECPVSAETPSQVDLCADVITCPNGDCAAEYQETHDATDDFKRAAASLSLAAEAAQTMEHDELMIFGGSSKSCHNSALGFASCCAGSGWGIDLRLSRCSSDEFELGIARQEGRAHYVGRYSSGFLGLTARNVYCVYPSKLVRLVVEQGKAQLAAGYGSPQHPDCSGFSPDVLESLDFDAMDLSELYEDLLTDAAGRPMPDPEKIAEQLRRKVKRMARR